MALRKVVFDSATVAAKDFGALFAGTLTDGRVDGCDVSYAGGSVSVAVGYLIACVRLIQNNAALTVTPEGSTGVAQIVLVVNLTGSGTVSVATRYASSAAALSALTQDDINDGSSTLYELELALVDLEAASLLRSLAQAAPAAHTHTLDQITSISSGSADPGTLAVGELYLQYEV